MVKRQGGIPCRCPVSPFLFHVAQLSTIRVKYCFASFRRGVAGDSRAVEFEKDKFAQLLIV